MRPHREFAYPLLPSTKVKCLCFHSEPTSPSSNSRHSSNVNVRISRSFQLYTHQWVLRRYLLLLWRLGPVFCLYNPLSPPISSSSSFLLFSPDHSFQLFTLSHPQSFSGHTMHTSLISSAKKSLANSSSAPVKKALAAASASSRQMLHHQKVSQLPRSSFHPRPSSPSNSFTPLQQTSSVRCQPPTASTSQRKVSPSSVAQTSARQAEAYAKHLKRVRLHPLPFRSSAFPT